MAAGDTPTNDAQAVFDALAAEIEARGAEFVSHAADSRREADDYEAQALVCREIAAEIRAGRVRNRAPLRHLLLLDLTKMFERRFSSQQLRNWWLGKSASESAAAAAPRQEPPQ